MATAHAWVVFRSLGTSHGQPIQYIACVYTLPSRGAGASVQTQARPLPARSLAHSQTDFRTRSTNQQNPAIIPHALFVQDHLKIILPPL